MYLSHSPKTQARFSSLHAALSTLRLQVPCHVRLAVRSGIIAGGLAVRVAVIDIGALRDRILRDVPLPAPQPKLPKARASTAQDGLQIVLDRVILDRVRSGVTAMVQLVLLIAPPG